MYLEPLDILRLSRTSKDLRNLLMPKSSEYIWRAARLNIEDLPPPPSDMNEVQYANFMFDKYCQVSHICFIPVWKLNRPSSEKVCGYYPCDNVFWAVRLRACKKCLNQTPLYDSITCVSWQVLNHFNRLATSNELRYEYYDADYDKMPGTVLYTVPSIRHRGGRSYRSSK
jgi:hypothetical protein